jgi:hypothetical protein
LSITSVPDHLAEHGVANRNRWGRCGSENQLLAALMNEAGGMGLVGAGHRDAVIVVFQTVGGFVSMLAAVNFCFMPTSKPPPEP